MQLIIGDTIPVLYEDNHLLVVNKPAGVLVQEDKTEDQDLLNLCKDYLKKKYNKPGNVYLGLVHRIDRPVSGTVVFARTSKAASRLSEQIRNRLVEKRYIALILGETPVQGEWNDKISRKQAHAFIDQKNGKPASLTFQRLMWDGKLSLVVIRLITGRHHQIRVQFGSRGFPILGDFRYGGNTGFIGRSIALHSMSFSCEHPTKKEKIGFVSFPAAEWPVENLIKILEG